MVGITHFNLLRAARNEVVPTRHIDDLMFSARKLMEIANRLSKAGWPPSHRRNLPFWRWRLAGEYGAGLKLAIDSLALVHAVEPYVKSRRTVRSCSHGALGNASPF